MTIAQKEIRKPIPIPPHTSHPHHRYGLGANVPQGYIKSLLPSEEGSLEMIRSFRVSFHTCSWFPVRVHRMPSPVCTTERHRKRWRSMNRKTVPESLCNCQKLPLHFPAFTLWDLHASGLLPKLLHQLAVDGHKVSHKKAQVWTVAL